MSPVPQSVEGLLAAILGELRSMRKDSSDQGAHVAMGDEAHEAAGRRPAGCNGRAVLVFNFMPDGKVTIRQWFGDRLDASYVSDHLHVLLQRAIPAAMQECLEFAVRGGSGQWPADGSSVTE